MVISGDNSKVVKLIKDLINLLENNGAWFSQDLVIYNQENNFSIRSKANHDHKKKYISIPVVLMPQLRYYKLTLESFNIKLEIKNNSEGNPVNDKIMQMIINIYNSTHKIKEWENAFFINQIKDYPEILHLIKKSFGFGRIAKYFDLYENKKNSELLLESYLHSRTFNLPHEVINKANLKDNEINNDQSVIMPIIDFYNHKLNAESFFIDRSLKPISMSVSSASEKVDGELMVCYNKGYDSINTYLSYGFIDTSSNFLKSIPLQFTIGNYQFKLKRNNKIYGEEIDPNINDLRSYLPYLVKENNSITISKIVIPSVKLAPFSIRRILIYLFSSTKLFNEKDLSIAVIKIEKLVINYNIRYWQDLLQISENKNDKNLVQLISLCKINLNHIHEYQQFHKNNLQ